MLVTMKPTRGNKLTAVVLHLGDNSSGRGPALGLVAKTLLAHQGLAAGSSRRAKEAVFDFRTSKRQK